MSVDLKLAPKTKRPAGERCCDPVRLQLVDVLRKHAGKVCVCELVPLFDLSQPTVSHHLKVLRDAGLVQEQRAGTRRIYSADAKALGELRAYVDEMWQTALGKFAQSASGPKRRKR